MGGRKEHVVVEKLSAFSTMVGLSPCTEVIKVLSFDCQVTADLMVTRWDLQGKRYSEVVCYCL